MQSNSQKSSERLSAALDSSTGSKSAGKEQRGSGVAPAKVRVDMESHEEVANGSDNAALRALVQKLPDLSYMLSDSLVLPPKTR